MLFASPEKLQSSNPGIGLMTDCVTAVIRDGHHAVIPRRMIRESEFMALAGGKSAGRWHSVEGSRSIGCWRTPARLWWASN